MPISPDKTMLPLEALDEMEDISGSALISAELRQLGYIRRGQDTEIVERARTGDKEARDIVVIACMNWTLKRAVQIYTEARPERLDVSEISSVGFLALVEKLDRALELEEPISYLMATAAWRMQSEAKFRDSLITKPRMSIADEKKRDPFPITLVDLEDGKSKPHPKQQPEKDYTKLYQALNEISSVQRKSVFEHYGLQGRIARPTRELALRENTTNHNIISRLSKARRSLAKNYGK